MLGLFTVVIAILAAIVVATALGIIVVRVTRRVREAERARLAEQPRKALLAFVADNGEEGGDELVAIPDDAWRAAEPHALALLGKLRGEAHLALVSVFLRRGAARSALGRLRSRSPVKRARAAQVLGDLEVRRAVPDLCRLLTDRYPEVRVVAVRALGRIGDPAAAWRIISSLDEPDPIPALLASHTLAQLGPEAEVTLSAALDHPEARVRAVCLDALGLLGATGSVHRIARIVNEDSHLDVRIAAATNLGKLGTRTALEPLSHALRESRPAALRAATARALGDLGSPSAVPYLMKLLADDAFQVAHEGAHALRRLGDTGLEALRTVIEEERAKAIAAGAGAHAQLSPAACHAEEALALAGVLRGESRPVGAAR